jgi:4'-phosphopantetheinyl transferase
MTDAGTRRVLELRIDEVHLWQAGVDCSRAVLDRLTKTLSADEAERADRFHFACDRSRFIASRGILRDILSQYLGCAPVQIRFSYEPSGKPKLRPMPATTVDLRFNLSHTENVILYAVSREKELGVDIEWIRQGILWEKIARCFFARREIEKLQQWPVAQRTTGFFICWTRKEAYVKARGDGLSIPLDSFEVSAGPGESPALLAAADPGELIRWSIWEVPVGQRLAAALVVEGRPRQLRLLQWDWAGLRPEEPAIRCSSLW